MSAFWRTVDVSSSIDDAVSSSEPACCSVRDDRSRLPLAISLAAPAISTLPLRTSVTSFASDAFMSFRASSICAASSLPRTSMRLVRSPAATVRATSTARFSGRTTERVITTAAPTDSSRAAAAAPAMMRSAVA